MLANNSIKQIYRGRVAKNGPVRKMEESNESFCLGLVCDKQNISRVIK